MKLSGSFPNFFFQIPKEIISSGEDLLVRFRSDDTINWKGFSAIYSETDSDLDEFGETKELPLD
jgi:hypothetical protein